MSRRRRSQSAEVVANDPFPYHGPIARADGTRPYNRYLWPTEVWAANREPGLSGMIYQIWRIEVIALLDGRWSTSGSVHQIEEDRDFGGNRCCFATREEAIRASAARIIRKARRWRGQTDHFGRPLISEPQAFGVVAWALRLAQLEAGERTPTLTAAEAAREAAGAAAERAASEARERVRLACLPSQTDLFQ